MIHRSVASLAIGAVAVGTWLAVPGEASAAAALSATPPGMSARIVGGQPTTSAGIATRFFSIVQPNPDELCAGTVISDHWIVTAAHCTVGRNQPTVAINPSRFDQATFAPRGAFRIPWQVAVVHPQYNPSTLVNDIAVVRVKPVLTAQTLPFSSDISRPLLGASLQVFGFGFMNEESGQVSRFNRVASVFDLSGVGASSCGQYAHEDFAAAGEICAGVQGGGVDACNGDSGGPLTTAAEPRTLVGVVSKGLGCAEAAYPGVYTRLSAYAAWIAAVTGVPPNSPSRNTWGPAHLVAGKPCSGAPCTLRGARTSAFGVTNLGGRSARFHVIGSGFRISPRSGTVRPLTTQFVTVRAMGRASRCVSGSVLTHGRTLTTFNFGIGHRRC